LVMAVIADSYVRVIAHQNAAIVASRRWSRGALASPEDISGDQVERVCIDCPLRPDQTVPPARRRMARSRRSRHMAVTGEGMQDQHRIGAVVGAPGFVRHGDVFDARPALQRQRPDPAELPVSRRVRLPPRTGDGSQLYVGGSFHLAAFKPVSISARISSMPSMPTAKRTMPGETPA